MTDPQVLQFVKDSRARAYALVKLVAQLKDQKLRFDEIQKDSLIPNDEKDFIVPDSGEVGLSRINCANIVEFVAICEKIVGQISDLTDMPTVHLFLARPFPE